MVFVLATKCSSNECRSYTMFREGLLNLCDETETILHLECFLLLIIFLCPLLPAFLYKYEKNIVFIITKNAQFYIITPICRHIYVIFREFQKLHFA